MLTKQKLTTSIGYVKYRSRAEARRVAKKLDLQGTHSHQMEVNGMTRTIYMPSNSHSALNAELRKRGLPRTMVLVSGTRDMGSGGSDRMEMGMTGGGGMMPGPSSSSSPSAESMPGDLEVPVPSAETETPTPTATQTPTPTPEPTATPVPAVETPAPTPASTATPTTTETAAPTVTETPQPEQQAGPATVIFRFLMIGVVAFAIGGWISLQ